MFCIWYFKNLDWLGSEQRIRMLIFNKYKESTGTICSEELKFSRLSVYYHLVPLTSLLSFTLNFILGAKILGWESLPLNSCLRKRLNSQEIVKWFKSTGFRIIQVGFISQLHNLLVGWFEHVKILKPISSSVNEVMVISTLEDYHKDYETFYNSKHLKKLVPSIVWIKLDFNTV